MKLDSLVEATADLISVAAARLDASGTLLEANAGFLRLLEGSASLAPGTNVAASFIRPDFGALAAAVPGALGESYRGLLTIGGGAGRARTLRGRVWHTGGVMHVLAEFDIEELERVTGRMMELNSELTASQVALSQLNLALKEREAQIVEAVVTDPLTGVGNRRCLEMALAAELSRTRRTGEPLSALMADLDDFKGVNDRHGHAAGDKVLLRFAELLRSQTRPTDIVARYGGEEFVVLLPHADVDRAVAFAERVRSLFAAETIDPLAEPVTASFGAAQLRAGESGDALLDRADEALYRAKSGGRNRTVPETPAGEAGSPGRETRDR